MVNRSLDRVSMLGKKNTLRRNKSEYKGRNSVWGKKESKAMPVLKKKNNYTVERIKGCVCILFPMYTHLKGSEEE